MSNKPVFAFVINRGPDYTPRGERLDVCLHKAVAFNHIKNIIFKDEYNNEILEKPFDFISDIAWEDLKSNLLADTPSVVNRFKVMKYLINKKVDVLKCDEATTRDVLIQYITKEKNINKKASVDKICSYLRCAFKAIGREHAYSDGEMLKFMNMDFMSSKNPMSTSNVEIVNKMISEKTDGKSTKPGKYSPAASLAVVYTHILWFFQKAFILKKQENRSKNQEGEMENNASLAMILALLMHEGGRPGEFFREIEHEDLYFPTHELGKVYWLSLVFLSASSLNEIMEKYVLKKFVYVLYKGKTMATYKGRMKTSIPWLYNMLDLCFLYILYMKITFSPKHSFKSKLFEVKNYSHLLATKLAYFVKFTFYGIRYACCEEDEKYGIDEVCSKATLGHSKASVQKDKYAANNEARVNGGTGFCPLGADLMPNNSTSADIPHEFNPIQGAIVPSHIDLDVLTPACREEFVKVVDLTTLLIEDRCEDAYKSLCEMFDSDTSSIKIAVDNFVFPNGSLPKSLSDMRDRSVQFFKDNFKSFKTPSKFAKPWLWSYVQTRFGDFSGLVRGATETMVASVLPPKQKPTKPAGAVEGEAVVVDVDEDGELRLIDKIIKHRRKNNKVEYLVKWTNLPDSENSWIKKSNVTPDALEEYHADNPLTKPRKRARKS